MERINLKQARQRLSSIVTAAEHGESTTITRRGKAAAKVVPIVAGRSGRLPNLAAFRATLTSKGKALSAVVADLRAAERY